MKIDISFLAVFLLIGTDLLARAAVQGVEQALALTAFEYGSAGCDPFIKMGESDQGVVLWSVKRSETQMGDGWWN